MQVVYRVFLYKLQATILFIVSFSSKDFGAISWLSVSAPL